MDVIEQREAEEHALFGILLGTSALRPEGLKSSTLWLFMNRQLWMDGHDWWLNLDGETRYRRYGNATQRLRRRGVIAYTDEQTWKPTGEPFHGS
jgi:hypothetical protein